MVYNVKVVFVESQASFYELSSSICTVVDPFKVVMISAYREAVLFEVRAEKKN